MAWDKIPSQKEAVKSFLVVEDGKVNLDASTAKYRAACLLHVAGQTADAELIGTCMTSLFDTRKGVYMNMDYIKSQVSQAVLKLHPELNDPALFGNLYKRIETFLHENTGEGKTYGMIKARGFCRTSDQPVKAATETPTLPAPAETDAPKA